MDPILSDERSFGELNFSEAKLGDVRRTRSLVRLADLMAQHPGGSLPHKLRDPAALDALYLLCECPKVTHESVLAPHRDVTLQKIMAYPEDVLILHDSTEIDYTHQKSLKSLGQIGDGYGRGYIAQNSLAVCSKTGRAIGLTNQVLHQRANVSKKETRAASRERLSRESRLWVQGTAGLPASRKLIDVCDRGADTFEFIESEHARARHYVIRVSKDRKLLADEEAADEAEAIEQTLKGHARQLPDLGERTVTVSANTKQTARTATVRIAAGAVTIRPPQQKRGEHGDEPIATWVVHVREVNPPEGVEPLEWILLTDVPAESFAEACERVDWYACRPIVEEFHKGKKSGACIQDLQFTDEQRLEPVIALLSVVTALLLKLREAAREESAATTLAIRVVRPLHVKMLSLWRHGEVRMNMTIREFHYALARLGGHQNRKSDGFPGWITLWRGWQALQPMTEVAAVLERCGET